MKKRKYMAYLLRLWRENPSKPWRATLVNPGTAEKVSFAELGGLITYLEDNTGERISVGPQKQGDKA